MFQAQKRLILASGSPRRRDFMDGLGVAYEVRPSLAEEPRPENGESPASYAERMAVMKAREVAGRFPGAIIIGADSVVAIEEHILGKPTDEADAVRMLMLLSGKTHQVITGVCLIGDTGEEKTFSAATDVTMTPFPEAVAKAYAATGEPLDKAGAYAIHGQGGRLRHPGPRRLSGQPCRGIVYQRRRFAACESIGCAAKMGSRDSEEQHLSQNGPQAVDACGPSHPALIQPFGRLHIRNWSSVRCRLQVSWDRRPDPSCGKDHASRTQSATTTRPARRRFPG